MPTRSRVPIGPIVLTKERQVDLEAVNVKEEGPKTCRSGKKESIWANNAFGSVSFQKTDYGQS